ncbi:MAG: LPS assembly lipoprotein LptE [Acidobacteriota bacterium]
MIPKTPERLTSRRLADSPPSRPTVYGLESRRLALSILKAAALGLALLALSGCGYTLVGQASNLPEDIEEVFVAPLENSTSRQQVEQVLTQAIIDEMVTRRRFEVINSRERADAILRGRVTGFEVRPVTFDAEGLADNFEVSITADMAFERPKVEGQDEAEVIWKNSRYIFREDYELGESGTSSDFFDAEDVAIEETSVRFAETLVTDLLEGF